MRQRRVDVERDNLYAAFVITQALNGGPSVGTKWGGQYTCTKRLRSSQQQQKSLLPLQQRRREPASLTIFAGATSRSPALQQLWPPWPRSANCHILNGSTRP